MPQFVPLTPSGDSLPIRKNCSSPLSRSTEPFLRPSQNKIKNSSPNFFGKSRESLGNSLNAVDEKRRTRAKTLAASLSKKKNSSVVFLRPKIDYDESVMFKKKEKVKLYPQQEPDFLPPLLPIMRQPPIHIRDGNRYTRQQPLLYTPIYTNGMYVQANPYYGFPSLPSQQINAQHSPMYYPHMKTAQVTYYSPPQVNCFYLNKLKLSNDME